MCSALHCADRSLFRDESLSLPDIPPEVMQQVIVDAMQSLPAVAPATTTDSGTSARRKRQREEDESDGESSGVEGDSVQKRARTEHGWTGDAQPEASSSRVQLPPLAYPDPAAGTPTSVLQRRPSLAPARWDQTPHWSDFMSFDEQSADSSGMSTPFLSDDDEMGGQDEHGPHSLS